MPADTREHEADSIQLRIKEISRLIRSRGLNYVEKDQLRTEREELRERLQELDVFDPDQRLPRGYLANDVWIICRDWVGGVFTLDEGKFMTPYTVAKIMREIGNLDRLPSSGAITSVFKRWQEYGFATFRDNPFAFLTFREDAQGLSPTEFLKQRKSS